MLPMKLAPLIFVLAFSLHADDAKPTVEQLQAQVAQQQRELDQLKAYLNAIEAYDSRNVAVMQNALNACIGPRPQMSAPTKPAPAKPTAK